MTLDEFLTQLTLDLEDVCEDINFDCGSNSVAEQKVRQILKAIEDFQNEV